MTKTQVPTEVLHFPEFPNFHCCIPLCTTDSERSAEYVKYRKKFKEGIKRTKVKDSTGAMIAQLELLYWYELRANGMFEEVYSRLKKMTEQPGYFKGWLPDYVSRSVRIKNKIRDMYLTCGSKYYDTLMIGLQERFRDVKLIGKPYIPQGATSKYIEQLYAVYWDMKYLAPLLSTIDMVPKAWIKEYEFKELLK